jgi:serine/threonine protein kinase/predicted Zn-dependent protease
MELASDFYERLARFALHIRCVQDLPCYVPLAMGLGTPDQIPRLGAFPPGNSNAKDLDPKKHLQVADHELLRVVGRGAYGEVWLARHCRLGTLHAVKIVHRDQFDDPRPFQREFEGIRRYEPISREHPNLVAILHVGGTDDCFYYIMELADNLDALDLGNEQSEGVRHPAVEGPVHDGRREAQPSGARSGLEGKDDSCYVPRTLRAEIKRQGALPIERVLEIGHALAGALTHLHTRQLVHRDVKPSNVIFVGGVAKLADIGLVTGIDEARSFVGTEGFVPPEGPGTPSADCYSLGKLLYELSTGRDCTAWPEPAPEFAKHPDRERLLELNEIIHRACAPTLRERYPSAEEMRRDFALLSARKSLKARRERRQRWVMAQRVTIALSGLPILLAGAALLQRELRNRPLAFMQRHQELQSTNLDAAACYDIAMKFIGADEQNRMADAYTNLLEAIRLEPTFVSAYVALFEMTIREQFPGKPTNQLAQVRELATKLKGLAPELAATQTAQSIVQWADGHYEAALSFCRKAIAADASYELAHTHYGFLLTILGRIDEGRRQVELAELLAPSKAVIKTVLGHTYYVRRQYDKAIEQYTKALNFQKDYKNAHYYIGCAYRAMGDYDKAIEKLENYDRLLGKDEQQITSHYATLRRAFRQQGPAGYWQEELRQAERDPDATYYWKATVHAQLGHTNEAFYFLDKSVSTRERGGSGWGRPFEKIIADEQWDRFRNDPAFKRIFDKIGFNQAARHE